MGSYIGSDASKEIYASDLNRDGNLRRFQAGLRQTHQGNRSHNTVLGHSYGTTAVGYTARDSAGLDADELVLVASPGAGVDYASQLHGISSGHVWATTAAFDSIRLIPDFWYGNNPCDSAFGAHQFETDWDSDHGHTTYWDGTYQSNSVRRGIAGIVTHNYTYVA
jgi:pimeloyl-ACP methyl ester carboxylesterase